MNKEKIVELISTVQEAFDYIKSNPSESSVMLDGCNEALGTVKDLMMSNQSEEKTTFYMVDDLFSQRINGIKNSNADEVFRHIERKFMTLRESIREQFEKYVNEFRFWGTLNIRKKDFGIFKNRAEALKNHADDFMWLYNKLADYRSRYTLYAFIDNWLNFNMTDLFNVKENIYKSYFDPDIMKCGENEVLVDLGAFIGDTVSDYFLTYGRRCKKIYCYEISPITFEQLNKNISEKFGLDKIVLRQKGTGAEKGVMYISENNKDASANILSEKGEIEVEVVTIDEDITELITFLKMDIEGAEQEALRGSVNHIRNSKPKLALSIYHNNEDVWKIPRMVDEISPGYKFYLRYHGGDLLPSELTLLAVYED